MQGCRNFLRHIRSVSSRVSFTLREVVWELAVYLILECDAENDICKVMRDQSEGAVVEESAVDTDPPQFRRLLWSSRFNSSLCPRRSPLIHAHFVGQQRSSSGA